MKLKIATALLSTTMLAATPALAQDVYEQDAGAQIYAQDAGAQNQTYARPPAGQPPMPGEPAGDVMAEQPASGDVYAPAQPYSYDMQPNLDTGPRGGVGTENGVGETAVDQRVPGAGGFAVAYLADEAVPGSPAPAMGTAAPTYQDDGISAAPPPAATPDRMSAAPAPGASVEGNLGGDAQGGL